VRAVRSRVTVAATFGLLAAACGGGGGVDTAAACALVERLGETARSVEEADVADPARFAETLDAAIAEYVAVVDDLRTHLPDELQDDLDRLEAAASQHRFTDGTAARVALERYAEEACAPEEP
jgi:hypothetical protein